ncbi:MAG: AarF/ABC1/UbiB kinase family protein, partial [Planctomycetota bacterium]
MRITTIPQVYRNVSRWREILATLSKYGLADWLSRFDLALGKNWLKSREGQSLSSERRECRIRMALEELGPTFIKLGQIMSTRPDVVGASLANELQKLQARVPADPPEAVAELLELEFGKPHDQVFQTFDAVPVASASIGQVHKATLPGGEVVAVKVQHAEIQDRVHVDLDILAGLAELAENLPELETYRPVATVGEFQRALRRELDFNRELRHVEEFGRDFEGDESVRVPKPYPELSTDRVLVMEWIAGVPFSDRDGLQATGVDLEKVACSGAELYLEMVFTHGFYHADPHPGNLLLMPDGAIGLLDYGMVVRLDENLRENIEDLLMAIVSQDAKRLASVVMRVGTVPANLDETALGVELGDFVAHYGNQPIERFDLSGAVNEIIDLLRRYGIVQPAPMMMLLKVLVMLEGTAQGLSPNFCLMEVLQPYQSRLVSRRLSPARQLRKAQRLAYEVEQFAEVVPRRVRDILNQVQSGSFEVHLD